MSHRPRLVVTVTAATMADLRARRDAVVGADLVELRLDGVRDPDVAGALQGRRTPVILTCRAAWEGGGFRGAEEERRRLLAEAMHSDAEYVDLEWRAGFDDLVGVRRGRGVVLSHHDFDGVPGDLATRAAAMAATGAEVTKLAVTVDRLAQTTGLLHVSRAFAPGRSVVIGMGEAGIVTRVCAAKFGAAWSYAGVGVAPGQISPERMAREFGFGEVGADTALYGLAGRPVHHSLSPAMHNASFRALGLDAVYVPLAPAGIEDLQAFAEAFGVRGLSVTAPFKTEVLGMVSRPSNAVRAIGAANTLTREGEVWVADNTDEDGFLAPLAKDVLTGARVAILGNGGAARAVARAVMARGASATLYGRDRRKAEAVAGELGAVGSARPVPAGSWDLLINTTPVGTFPATDHACPETSFEGRLVYDLVYNPPETTFVRAARAAGCRAIGGLDMLVHQARLQQYRWCGVLPSCDVMHQAAVWRLSTFASES